MFVLTLPIGFGLIDACMTVVVVVFIVGGYYCDYLCCFLLLDVGLGFSFYT